MEQITSRKNPLLMKIRKLAAGSRRDRREAGEYLGDGRKLLEEALKWGTQLTTVVVSQSCLRRCGLFRFPRISWNLFLP